MKRKCGQKNTCDSVNIDLYRTIGDPQLVSVVGSGVTCGLNLSCQQAKLLKTVVDYLNQASVVLSYGNHTFLSNAAKDLSKQINDQFSIR